MSWGQRTFVYNQSKRKPRAPCQDCGEPCDTERAKVCRPCRGKRISRGQRRAEYRRAQWGSEA